MSFFAARLTRQPVAFDLSAAADTKAAFGDLVPELHGLLAASAGCSPFLKGLMQREADWLRQALAGAPEAALEKVLQGLAPLGLDSLPGGLRQAKRRVALLTALADLGGVWPLEQVTGAPASA